MLDRTTDESLRTPVGLLPLRGTVLFPGGSLRIDVGRPRSVALIETLVPGDLIVVSSQKNPKVVDPSLSEIAAVGTVARVTSIRRTASSAFRIVLEGLSRFEIASLSSDVPFLAVEGKIASETEASSSEGAVALWDAIEDWAKEGGGKTPKAVPERELAQEDPGAFADAIASVAGFDLAISIALLAELDVDKRLTALSDAFDETRSRVSVKRKIESEVKKSINKTQREHILREQLKAIKRELGEASDEKDGKGLKERLDEIEFPDEVREIVDRELNRLEAAGQGPESNVIRTYLDWIASLPWNERAPSEVELNTLAEQLDRDHEGLTDVKKRILEHMAVHKLAGNPRGTILCLVGPPGVGKTSLGESIAEATGRPFVRIALGGLRDEAEIRGHRRTYVGALPGRIIHALKKAKVKNPIILLDEIDKLSQGWSGNPEAALLEVLDPEQNHTFADHYLEASFDLSEVLFLCTANSLETISGPLRDRLEIVELSGYTRREKLSIAKNHLAAKRIKEHGLNRDDVVISDDALNAVIEGYTREAGVRQLSREIARLCRHAALETARVAGANAASDELPRPAFDIDRQDVAKILGKEKFSYDLAEREAQSGVATGLAWTPVGGDILFIETTRMPGKGRLETTGQLGDVMKESARAALTYVRSHADELGIDAAAIEQEDIHIHIPAGAVPKDGPSAGVTIFTALASLFSDKKVRADTAMTGECSLRGRVLPVGGITSKVLAAHRAGIRRIILPSKNARDVADIPEEVRDELEFILADNMQQVLAAALEDTQAPIIDSGLETTASSAPA